jgi:uncharacterized protein YaeQ
MTRFVFFDDSDVDLVFCKGISQDDEPDQEHSLKLYQQE